jgi:hypothetical protein
MPVTGGSTTGAEIRAGNAVQTARQLREQREMSSVSSVERLCPDQVVVIACGAEVNA